jgi:hypothetical protein
MTHHDRQLTASDIKGDLAQRLRCPVCTVPFNQVQGRNKIDIEKQETKESSRKAISFICDGCKEKGIQPDTAFRLIIASDGTQIINEVRVEDLPALGTASARSDAPRRTRTASRRAKATRGGRREKKTTPTEQPTAPGALEAARPKIATLDE